MPLNRKFRKSFLNFAIAAFLLTAAWGQETDNPFKVWVENYEITDLKKAQRDTEGYIRTLYGNYQLWELFELFEEVIPNPGGVEDYTNPLSVLTGNAIYTILQDFSYSDIAKAYEIQLEKNDFSLELQVVPSILFWYEGMAIDDERLRNQVINEEIPYWERFAILCSHNGRGRIFLRFLKEDYNFSSPHLSPKEEARIYGILDRRQKALKEYYREDNP